MKKENALNLGLSIAFLTTLCVLLFWTINTKSETPGSLITCYSTFRVSGTASETKYLVLDCGTCKEIECYEYRDSGKCTISHYVFPLRDN